MTIAADKRIEPGQLWELHGICLYVVEPEHSGDICYPILLREVARTPAHQQTLDAYVRGYADRESAESNAARARRVLPMSTMQQEHRWFELRPDVRQWTASVDEWKEAQS